MARSYPHNRGRHAVRDGRDDAYQCSLQIGDVTTSCYPVLMVHPSCAPLLFQSPRRNDERMPSTLRSVDDDVLGVICAILDKNEVRGYLSLCSIC